MFEVAALVVTAYWLSDWLKTVEAQGAGLGVVVTLVNTAVYGALIGTAWLGWWGVAASAALVLLRKAGKV